MANESMVPLLPCASIDEIGDFAAALGFEVTYRQTRPNPYLALRREGIDLHYFGIEGFRPEDSYGSCLVVVDDTEPLYDAWAAGLRAAHGRLPLSGFPRITRPRRRANADGLSGFSLVDPAGNWIRVVRRAPSEPAGVGGEATDGAASAVPVTTAAGPAGGTSSAGSVTDAPADGVDPAELGATLAGESRLLRAVSNAVVQADSRGDVEQAAKVLDGALRRDEALGDAGASARDRVEAQAYRAELAVRLDDAETAERMLDEVDRCVAAARGQHLTQDLTTILTQLEDVREWLDAQR